MLPVVGEKRPQTIFHSIHTGDGMLRQRQRLHYDKGSVHDTVCEEEVAETASHCHSGEKARETKPILPRRQYIANIILQFGALAAAIAFGTFAVQSVHLANHANHYAAMAVNQSMTQNQLAVYAICMSGQSEVCRTSRQILLIVPNQSLTKFIIEQNATLPAPCSEILAEEYSLLPSIVFTLFTRAPISATPGFNLSSSTTHRPSTRSPVRPSTDEIQSTSWSTSTTYDSNSPSLTLSTFHTASLTPSLSPNSTGQIGNTTNPFPYRHKYNCIVFDCSSWGHQVLFIVSVLISEAFVIGSTVMGVRYWRRRRAKAKTLGQNIQLAELQASHLTEDNPLLVDWVQQTGTKSGLQLLAEKLQGYDLGNDMENQSDPLLGPRHSDESPVCEIEDEVCTRSELSSPVPYSRQSLEDIVAEAGPSQRLYL